MQRYGTRVYFLLSQCSATIYESLDVILKVKLGPADDNIMLYWACVPVLANVGRCGGTDRDGIKTHKGLLSDTEYYRPLSTAYVRPRTEIAELIASGVRYNTRCYYVLLLLCCRRICKITQRRMYVARLRSRRVAVKCDRCRYTMTCKINFTSV